MTPLGPGAENSYGRTQMLVPGSTGSKTRMPKNKFIPLLSEAMQIPTPNNVQQYANYQSLDQYERD